jgi:hypothetical protein
MRTEVEDDDRAGDIMAALIALLIGSLAVAVPAVAWAQSGVALAGRSTNELVDIALNALEGPVVQPLLVPPGAQRGIPAFPPYKQEPPAAQRDFRSLPSPAGLPPPNPGAGGADPGGAGGPGATSPIGTVPPPTVTPPVVGPIPPFPVPFPGPPPGGGGPVLPLRPPRLSRVP